MRRAWLAVLVLGLAGCSEDPPPRDGSAPIVTRDPLSNQTRTFAPHDGFAGLQLSADLTHAGDDYVLTAEARNDGTATYWVQTMCYSPWSERMERDGLHVQHRPTVQVTCQGYGYEEMPPGSSMHEEWVWNGTVAEWDGRQDHWRPASEGAYQWTAAFKAYAEWGDAEEPTATEVREAAVDVVVS